jgi:hypothetical protein
MLFLWGQSRIDPSGWSDASIIRFWPAVNLMIKRLQTWQACMVDEHDATSKSTICDRFEQEELWIA